MARRPAGGADVHEHIGHDQRYYRGKTSALPSHNRRRRGLTPHQRPHGGNQRNQPLLDPLLRGQLVPRRTEGVRIMCGRSKARVGGLLGLCVGEGGPADCGVGLAKSLLARAGAYSLRGIVLPRGWRWRLSGGGRRRGPCRRSRPCLGAAVEGGPSGLVVYCLATLCVGGGGLSRAHQPRSTQVKSSSSSL